MQKNKKGEKSKIPTACALDCCTWRIAGLELGTFWSHNRTHRWRVHGKWYSDTVHIRGPSNGFSDYLMAGNGSSRFHPGNASLAVHGIRHSDSAVVVKNQNIDRLTPLERVECHGQ